MRSSSPIFGIIDALKYGSWIGAGLLLLASLLLVANTIRLAAMARRREIGIMRLVGASTLYIALPFLLESLVTAAIGVGLTAGALAAFTKFAIMDGLAEAIQFVPWIGWDEYVESLIGALPPGIVILGAGADPDPDTPTDPQIHQSLIRRRYGRGVHFPEQDWLYLCAPSPAPSDVLPVTHSRPVSSARCAGGRRRRDRQLRGAAGVRRRRG